MIAVSDPLHDAVARLVTVHAEVLALSARSDAEWRRELIALRRRLQQEIADIATLIHAMNADDADTPRLRSTFARMRSTVALHQASWPAVAIDRADPLYQASVRDVRVANREFLALVAPVSS